RVYGGESSKARDLDLVYFVPPVRFVVVEAKGGLRAELRTAELPDGKIAQQGSREDFDLIATQMTGPQRTPVEQALERYKRGRRSRDAAHAIVATRRRARLGRRCDGEERGSDGRTPLGRGREDARIAHGVLARRRHGGTGATRDRGRRPRSRRG